MDGPGLVPMGGARSPVLVKGWGGGGHTPLSWRGWSPSSHPQPLPFKQPQPRGRSPGPRPFSLWFVIIGFHQVAFLTTPPTPSYKEP